MNAQDETPFMPEAPQPLLREIAPGAAYPVAALAVQGFADVETLGGNRPLALYALTIARSGERK